MIDNNNKMFTSCYLTFTTNNNSLLKASPNGLLSAQSVGKTELTAMTDDCFSNTVKVHIFENTDPPKPKKGGGFPKVLKSGIDPDPCVEGSTESLCLMKLILLFIKEEKIQKKVSGGLIFNHLLLKKFLKKQIIENNIQMVINPLNLELIS